MSTIQATAALRRELASAGFRPVPLYTNDKRPYGNGWPERARQNPPEAATVAPDARALNTGILCDGLRVIDLDIEDPVTVTKLRELAENILGSTIVRTRADSARCALVYRAAEGEPRKRVLEGTAGKVEVLGHGQQLHTFGLHPTGAELQWTPAAPGDIKVEDLPVITEAQLERFLAAAAPLIGAKVGAATSTVVGPPDEVAAIGPRPPFDWPQGLPDLNAAAMSGLGHHWFDDLALPEKNALIRAVLSTPGMLAIADMARQEWLPIIFACADAEQRGANEAHSLAQDWSKTSKRYVADDFDRDWRSFRMRAGGYSIGTLLHAASVTGFDLGPWRAKVSQRRDPSASAVGNTSSRPRPIPDHLLPVPAFDPSWLPHPVQRWASDIASTLPAPLDYVAVNILVAAGSIIGNRVLVNLKQQTLWLEAPNIWGLCIGGVSTLKSPTAMAVIHHLGALEAAQAAVHQQAMAQYEAAMAIHKALKEQVDLMARQAAKAALRAAGGGPVMPPPGIVLPPPPAEPKVRRFYTTDTSYEALGALCAANQSGILVWADELSGLLSALDMEENRAARAFYLAGWNGQLPYTFDRITRGHIRLERFALGVLGNIQPTMVATFLTDAARRGASDGLAQRFSAMVYPDPVPRQYRDRPVDQSARAAASTAFQNLAALDPARVGATFPATGAPWLDLGPAAHGVFRGWLQSDVYAPAQDTSLPDAFREHVGKLPKLAAGIALIIHLMEGGTGPVPMGAVERAVAAARYFAAHARRVYAAAGSHGREAARLLAHRISAGTVTGEFTLRDARRRGWTGFDVERVAIEALEELEDLGWVNRTDVPPTAKGGRPTMKWTINPLGRGAPV